MRTSRGQEARKRAAMLELYTFCCAGLKRVQNFEGKRFVAQMAKKIHGIADGHLNLEDSGVSDVGVEVNMEDLQPKELKLPESSVSIPSKKSSNAELPQDQLLEETIQKYEGLIESLYKQLEESESEHQIQLQALKSDCEARNKLKKQPSSGQCNCPVDTLQAEISRLEKEIRKRDKERIKRLKAKADNNK